MCGGPQVAGTPESAETGAGVSALVPSRLEVPRGATVQGPSTTPREPIVSLAAAPCGDANCTGADIAAGSQAALAQVQNPGARVLEGRT